MIRLDKYLADMGIGTRSEVKQFLKKGLVTVNGRVEKRPELKIDQQTDRICFQGAPVAYAEFQYYMFHKPAGCVSATQDNLHQTVLDYLKGAPGKELFPVGRLDIDTEGLLLVTNDGPLCHELLSPAKHVAKTYYAKVAGSVTAEDISLFAEGIDIGDDKLTAPAKLEVLSANRAEGVSGEDGYAEILLTITEGRFHQVKRMFEASGKKVVYLKRLSMGGLTLDETLAPGAYRSLTPEELAGLKKTEKRKIRRMISMLHNKKAVIFDLDGSLVDSMWLWKNIDIEFLAERGIVLPEDFQDSIEGMSFTETARYSKERFQLTESVDELKNIWNGMARDKYAHEVDFKPNARFFLEYCKEHQIRLGIATSNSRELVKVVSDALGLSDYIDVVVTGCDVAHGKPAPDVYLEAARQLQIPPEQCLVFEDVPAGIMAGKNAGMTVCGVEDEFSKDLTKKKRQLADYYISDYQQVLDNTYEDERGSS